MAVLNDGEANLGTIARALWRNKRSIIGPSLIVAAAAFIAVNLMTPKYKSEARVLFEGRENIFLRQIVLQKSFYTGDRKFSGPWTRLSDKHVRDLITR